MVELEHGVDHPAGRQPGRRRQLAHPGQPPQAGRPCAQKYVDSQARLLADWGFDFLKLDGVGPGSFKSGDNYDNVADVRAWKAAIARTGRPIRFLVSWSLDRGHAADWKANANGWRIDTDVECYCNTLVTWNSSVKVRWDDVPAWQPWAGPGGWNDLDSLDVGNGEIDGLDPAERRAYMTLRAISAAPLYTGDDVTGLDAYGKALLTNREVIAIDQQGVAARPVTPGGTGQVWGARNKDGSYTVALFNLGAVAGGAGPAACAACSGGKKIGNMYNGGALQFRGVRVRRDGIYPVNLRYVSGDPRSATVSANGQSPVTVSFPSSGGCGRPPRRFHWPCTPA